MNQQSSGCVVFADGKPAATGNVLIGAWVPLEVIEQFPRSSLESLRRAAENTEGFRNYNIYKSGNGGKFSVTLQCSSRPAVRQLSRKFAGILEKNLGIRVSLSALQEQHDVEEILASELRLV